MSGSIKLVTDFVDYYDELCDNSGSFEYRRMESEELSKGKALSYLKSLGVPTIQIDTIEYLPPSHKVIIYTNPNLHLGKGKIITERSMALLNYPNKLATPYVEGTNGVYLKFLQIGKRSFQLTMHNPAFEMNLNPGHIIGVHELPSGYNSQISLPIFSIDYIPCNGKMLAVDFNNIQNLSSIGFQNVMSKSEVVNELLNIFNRR